MKRLLLASTLLLTACPAKPPRDPLASARQRANSVAPRLESTEKARIDATVAALNEVAAMDAAPFVHPVIAERSRLLGERLRAHAQAKSGAMGAGVWAALSSDGAIFASTDEQALVPFTRPFNGLDPIREALTSGAVGLAVGRFGATPVAARLHVAAVRSAGAVVGAVVVYVPLADDAQAVGTAVASGGTAPKVCIRAAGELACGAADPALEGRVRDAAVGRVTDVAGQGVVVARAASAPVEVVAFVPKS